MKAYSIDLRQKVVERAEGGALTQGGLARQFRVSIFLSSKCCAWRRNGEQIAVKRSSGCRKPHLTARRREFVKAELIMKNDLTFCELSEPVAEDFQPSGSAATDVPSVEKT